MNDKALKRGRTMYVMEAALEYFISIMVAGSFLATLTSELGFSDSLTGILSSIISLGCLFQLLSIFIRCQRVKGLVVFLSIFNQILFMLLYVIPIVNIGKTAKTVIFVILIFSAYFIYNLAHPKKINWLMSLVDDSKRGSFTATKEIISLISGIIFSFAMGAVIDYFSEIGKIKEGFIVSAVTIFVLMTLHSLTMIFAVERNDHRPAEKNFMRALRDLVKNRNVMRVTILFILYYASTYVSTPFYGTYQINELGMGLTFVSAIVMCGSISRATISRFWGKYADKNSFTKMIRNCLVFLALSQLCVIFAVPETGKVAFVLYYILHGVALGGINSALINLIFDYVPTEQRSDSLAITQAAAGLTGFLTTLFVSPLVTLIQKNGNRIFGLPLYAQQFVTVIALIFTVTAIVYTTFAFNKKQ